MPRNMLIGVLTGATVLAAPLTAHALRCGTHLLSEGDTRGELLARCGDPVDASRRVVERVVRRRVRGQILENSVAVVQETLVFNFGSQRFLREVVLEDGIIRRIDTLGPGFDPKAQGGLEKPVRLGHTRVEVKQRWGEPVDIDVRQETVTTAQGFDGSGRPTARLATAEAVTATRVTVEVEVWTFNFGPNRLMRRVTFRDGRVVATETLDHGY